MKLVNLQEFYLVFQYKDVRWNLHSAATNTTTHEKEKITQAVLGSAKIICHPLKRNLWKKEEATTPKFSPHCSSSFVPSASGHRSARQAVQAGQTHCGAPLVNCSAAGAGGGGRGRRRRG